MSKYAQKKEQIREQAIEWQESWNDNCYSYGELAFYSDYFEKMGRRYGLLKEFQENAII